MCWGGGGRGRLGHGGESRVRGEDGRGERLGDVKGKEEDEEEEESRREGDRTG